MRCSSSCSRFCRDAHHRDDEDTLERVYLFAAWCYHQRRGSDLGNAVAVSFYEHLFDDWSIRDQVAKWLEPEIVDGIWPLWEARLDPEHISELRQTLARAQQRPRRAWIPGDRPT
jgi:hypothetical protein